MAAKLRNVLNRNGRFYARLTVPLALRKTVGKRELLASLGADRTIALRKLNDVLAGFQAQLESARQALDAPPQAASAPPTITAAMTFEEKIAASLIVQEASLPKIEKISIKGLFKAYIAELKLSGKGSGAEKRWKPCFDELIDFLGHDDANRVSQRDFVRYKERLLKIKEPKTVRDCDFGGIKAVFAWAQGNLKIDQNPARDIRVKVRRKPKLREKGFTDDEALAILKAARNYVPPPSSNPATRERPPMTAAKRWVPWLAAHTGARVAELTQLRKEDIQTRDGIHFLRLSPEAGSIKTSEYRDVPIHPQLVELGFLEFVKAAPEGPLFFSPKKTYAATHPSKTVAGRISQWVRSLKVIPENVDPNHGWRHRFKTVGHEAGVDSRVLDAIQGHAPRTAGDGYGDITLKARKIAIEKMPSFVIQSALN